MNRRSTFYDYRRSGRGLSRLAVAAAVLAIAAATTALLSSFGTRWGWWHFSTGFAMLRPAAYAGIAAAVLSLAAIYAARPSTGRRGLALAVAALFVGLATFVVLWQVDRLAQRVPPIHDITTDTENPPEFDAIVALREDAPNPVEYGGPEIAAQQREAYPDIEPLVLDVDPLTAFRAAFEAAKGMGWEIVATDSSALRIEATAKTFWYGFKDDVVIRVTQLEGAASVVDVRSVSRVGRGDLGVNARRVRRYLGQVESHALERTDMIGAGRQQVPAQ